MKKLILLSILLIIGCEEPAIEGCTIATACNYNADATAEDESCIEPQGCNEWCEGDSLQAQEFDCADVCAGDAVIDECGTCDSDSSNDCVQDCAGDWGGDAVDCMQDCAGTWGGSEVISGCDNECSSTATQDMCGNCDDDPSNDCVQDCAGIWGGDTNAWDCGCTELSACNYSYHATVDDGSCDLSTCSDYNCIACKMIEMGYTRPEINHDQEYIAGLDIPITIEQEFWEVQNDLNDIIGGYNRFFMLIYSKNSNQENTQPVFDKLKEIGYYGGADLTLDTPNWAGCLTGVGHDRPHTASEIGSWSPDPYDLCIMDYEFIQNPHGHGADPIGAKAIIYHSWAHEYFHAYQRRYTLDRKITDGPYAYPTWWVEGSAGLLPDLWLRNNWEKFNAFAGLTFDDVAVEGMKVNEVYKFQRRIIMGLEPESSEIPEENLLLGTKDERYDTINHPFIGTANAYLAYLTSYETVWVSIPKDAYELEFEGSFIKHVGMNLQEFYDDYNNFMRQGHHDDDPPDGFYPEGDIKDYVDFWQ